MKFTVYPNHEQFGGNNLSNEENITSLIPCSSFGSDGVQEGEP